MGRKLTRGKREFKNIQVQNAAHESLKESDIKLEEIMTSLVETVKTNPPVGKKRKKTDKLAEIKRFRAIQEMKEFKELPMKTIQLHLKNSIQEQTVDSQ